VLEELHVSGLGVIREATLEFAPGLNVLTGETGAGKTMITVALGLALGARASPALVRKDARGLAVEARFSVADGQPVADVALPSEGDVASWAEDGEIVLARTVSADGRSGARVSGKLAPAGALADVGRSLVEVHGQSQAERLASSATQTDFLDRFSGAEHHRTVQDHGAVHADLRRATEALLALERDAREREREKDLLAYQAREIEAANVRPGELSELDGEEARLAHAERILERVAAIEDALGGGGSDADGAVHRLSATSEAAAAIASMDRTANVLHDRASSLAAEAGDLLDEVRRYGSGLELDPGRLEAIRQRVQVLRSLERKYGEGEEGILAYGVDAAARLASLQDDEGTRRDLEDRIEELGARRRELADRITRGRTDGAPRLAGLLRQELQELGMPGATLQIELETLSEPSLWGAERVVFLFAGGEAQTPMPLGRVASGGELSRAMLACRSVQADLDDVPTLVFDEVDAGVGGRAAVAIGRRLARLARERQVIVVTHLAQIAARADRHFLVTKVRGAATVRPVQDDERAAELARMLSGTVGEVSLAHARELLGTGAGRG